MLNTVARLADLAEGQHGQITGGQAEAVGVAPQAISELINARILEEVIPGVVRLRGGARHPNPRLYAAWLLLEPQRPAWERDLPHSGVVTGGAALRAYKILDLPGGQIEILSPTPQDLVASPNVVVREATLSSSEWRNLAGLPVTQPGRTLAEITVSGRVDPADLGKIAAAFLRSGLAQEPELAAGLEQLLRSSNRSGDGLTWLGELLDAADPATSPGI